MDTQAIRRQFARFAGSEVLDRFMRALHLNPTCRRRLLHWQEKLWSDFRVACSIDALSHDQILSLFTYCHRHDSTLAEGVPESIRAYDYERRTAGTHYLREAYGRVSWHEFPFAAYVEFHLDSSQPARSWHCADCCTALLRLRDKAHRDHMSIAERDKHVYDIEEELVDIFDRFGDGSEADHLEAMGIHYVEGRPAERADDEALAQLVALLDETAIGLMRTADLFLHEAPAEGLRAFIAQRSDASLKTRSALGEDLNRLAVLFDLQVSGDRDREILRKCQLLYFLLDEFYRQSS